MYFEVFLNRNSSYQENAKTKVYALEDSLGVCCVYIKQRHLLSIHKVYLDIKICNT